MSLDPGTLRHRITLQQRVNSEDSNGDLVESWEDVATVWAACEPVSVRDFIASRSEQSELTARFVIRYRDDIDASMRIIHRGAVYNIAGVLPDKESGLEYLTLPCRSGVNAG
jgi:SPP1 family predicted phage head-tail adaptor